MGLTQPIKPFYLLSANSKDITATIRERFVSLRLTDETGNTSDMLEIVLADNAPEQPIEKPATGAQLVLSLGYDGVAVPMGQFIVDEIDLIGPPEQMHIRARAAAYDQGNDGAFHLQTQKVRSWAAGTTISAMVKKIASEHGMQGLVATSLASVALPHVDQQDESDLNLLLRIARKYDAVVKPAGSKLVMAKHGEFKGVSGQSLPAVTIQKMDCADWHYSEQRRESAGTVAAYYHATKQAKRHIVSVGYGEPVRRIKQYFSTQAEALAAAKADLAKRTRAMLRMSITLPGRTDLVAEAQVTLHGFRAGIPTTWIATRVEHSLNDRGYVCSVELEQPDAGQQNDVSDEAQ